MAHQHHVDEAQQRHGDVADDVGHGELQYRAVEQVFAHGDDVEVAKVLHSSYFCGIKYLEL